MDLGCFSDDAFPICLAPDIGPQDCDMSDFPNDFDRDPANWHLKPKLGQPIAVGGDPAMIDLINEAADLAESLGLFDAFRRGLKYLLTADLLYTREATAMRANRVWVEIRPADQFLEFLSALRAGDKEGFLAFVSAHGGSSQ